MTALNKHGMTGAFAAFAMILAACGPTEPEKAPCELHPEFPQCRACRETPQDPTCACLLRPGGRVCFCQENRDDASCQVPYRITARVPETTVVPETFLFNENNLADCFVRNWRCGTRIGQSSCANARECIILPHSAGTFPIVPVRASYFFAPRQANVGEANQEVSLNWDGPGTWGVQVGIVNAAAPGGIDEARYYDRDDTGSRRPYYFKTDVGKSGYVEILGGFWEDVGKSTVLTDHDFVGWKDGTFLVDVGGAVAQDFSTISYHWVNESGTERNVVFVRR